MPSLFVDSSALVKRYRNEQGSRRTSELLESAEQLVIARLTVVEVSSALVRRARATNVPAEELTAAFAAFDVELRRSFDVVELDETAMSRAVVLARRHGLRGADAVQLACALLSRSDLPASVSYYFVSADDELNAAAIAEGLRVENPNLH